MLIHLPSLQLLIRLGLNELGYSIQSIYNFGGFTVHRNFYSTPVWTPCQHKLTFYNGENLHQISVNYVYRQKLNCKVKTRNFPNIFDPFPLFFKNFKIHESLDRGQDHIEKKNNFNYYCNKQKMASGGCKTFCFFSRLKKLCVSLKEKTKKMSKQIDQFMFYSYGVIKLKTWRSAFLKIECIKFYK